MIQKITLLLLALALTACGKSGGSAPDTPTPYPAGETPGTIKFYVEGFKARYGVDAKYPILYDTASETGGSGAGGTTVGVCRMWSSGHRDILINREWWLARTRYPNANGYQVFGTDFQNNSSVETKSYSLPGSFQQRNNTFISLRNVPNQTGLVASGITGSANLGLENKSCSSAPNSVCRVDIYINENLNMAPGNYSESVRMGAKTVNISFTIVASTGGITTGEIYQRVLIYHEMGHCSFNLKHNCNTVAQNSSDVRCPGTNSADDPGNYTVATEGGNRPLSLMYPTVNPQAYFYEHGFSAYYEQEIYDNRVGDIFVGSQTASYDENLYSPLHMDEEYSDHDHELDGVKLDDGIRYMY